MKDYLKRIGALVLVLMMACAFMPISIDAVFADNTGGTKVFNFNNAADCQRSPAYPKKGDSFEASGFGNPLNGYCAFADSMEGSWSLVSRGLYTGNDADYTGQYGLSEVIGDAAYIYGVNSTEVEVFELLESGNHIAYGVICGVFDGSALYIGDTWSGGGGYVLSNKELSLEYSISGEITQDVKTGVDVIPSEENPQEPSVGPEKAEGPAAPTGLEGEKPSVIAGDDGKITGVDETMEYSTDGGETWTPVEGKEITGLSAGDIQVRVKETEKVKAGKTATVTVPEQKTIRKVDNVGLTAGYKLITGKNITIKWGAVDNADGYDIYMNYCGKQKPKLIKSVKSGTLTATIKKLKGKSINQKKTIKCYIVAYKMLDGKKVRVAKSICGHAVGKKNKKVTDAKKVTVKKSSFNLNVDGTAKIKAKTVKVKSKLPILKKVHDSEFRYVSTDDSIATVSKGGTIKAKSEGTCYVYVYVLNGMAKKIKVTVL